MRNLQHNGSIWVFRIPWVGYMNPSTVLSVSLIVVVLLIAVLTNLPLEESIGLAPETAGNVLFVAYVVALFVTIFLESTGMWARYEMRFDLDTRQVTAYDRRADHILWKTTYDPERLYISETRVGRYGVARPALVYGNSHQDLVKWDIPTQRKTMLAVAARVSLKKLLQDLKN